MQGENFALRSEPFLNFIQESNVNFLYKIVEVIKWRKIISRRKTKASKKLKFHKG